MDVLYAAAEPGSANVLACFLEDHARRLGTYRILATEGGAAPFARAGLVPHVLSEPIDELEVAGRWSAAKPRVLVTGTSLEGRLESALWRLATRDGVVSLAWLDQWTNLARRFRDGRPQWVAAIDDPQREELIALGFPSERVIVAGHPYLDGLAEQATPLHPKCGCLRVLFVSEPFAADIAAGRLENPGFDEFAVLNIVHAAARRARRRLPGQTISLKVKLHPLESARPMAAAVAALPAVDGVETAVVPGSVTGRPLLDESDLVIGMSSLLLIEAALSRRPVLSLQPGLSGEDGFILGRRGQALTGLKPDKCAALAEAALCDPALRDEALARQSRFISCLGLGGAAAVADWIDHRHPSSMKATAHEVR